MASLKSLAKDTAVYGLSSIVGRFLNYLLVPIYTTKISAASGGYGIVTNVYAYTALLMVLLTYGMETTFFRFANKEGEDAHRVYGTILTMVACTSLLFVAVVVAFISPISQAMGYADHPEYVWTMAVVVAMDAFQCIPFSYLRYKKRAIKFASLKMLFIVLNITLNVFFFVFYPQISGEATPVGYVFYINLGCTAFIMLCFYKELFVVRPMLDSQLIRRMLPYSLPILVLGIAGILNQTADKILFPYVYKGADVHGQLGIYGAASKIAMIMAMITQAFRYAYEPFVFGKSKDKDNRDTYAKAMKFFVIFTLLAFLCVMGYINIIRYLIGRDYWEGLRVVPIVMVAEIMMGIYFNLSFWYKLIDKTIWGAWFSGAGCAVLIAVNIIFVPRYGYIACAWAGVAGYATAMLSSYFVGQRYYPIAYPMRSMSLYVVVAAIFYVGIHAANNSTLPIWLSMAVNTIIILLYILLVVKKEFKQKK
ncbi:MAG: lipopolysaccharide biosynthesis protein [Prevotella sp.]|nr:lipopolysaccharide biosynthesis protein [Prevotella sp.]